jgi:threonine/homoserine/homoserine lactone efflux protein
VVLRTSLADGPRAGTWAAAGSAAGNLVWGTTSVLGVAALLAAPPPRSPRSSSRAPLPRRAGRAGAARRLPRRPARGQPAAARAPPPAALPPRLASDLLNVKAGLFWTALVPQFLTTGGALLPVAMVTAMVALVFAWLTGYAHLAARLSATRRAGARAR